MKKLVIAFISFLILIIVMVSLVMCFKTENFVKDDSRIHITATLFPQYDFAKQIVGDKAEVELLIGAGVETHHYEPTAKDMVKLLDVTDMFLYTGEYLEPWTEDIIGSLNESDCKVVDISNGIELIKIEEFEERHLNSEILHEEYNHSHEDIENSEYHDEVIEHNENEVHDESEATENINNNEIENDNEHEHQEMYDGHIWQNPLNAVKMLENTLVAICEIDPENAEYYKANAENYKKQILDLDKEIEDLVSKSGRKEIAVGGEFAYSYFVERYNLKFVSVYTNCGHGEDPSIAKVKSVIDYINNHKMPAVFYEELSEGTVAKMIAEETEAEPLVLYSIHNGNPEKDTYISLLKKNLENLKLALKD